MSAGIPLSFVEQSPDQMGDFRPYFKTPIEGLYLAGASTFPGAGIEATVISGVIAADDICPGQRAAELKRVPVFEPVRLGRAGGAV